MNDNMDWVHQVGDDELQVLTYMVIGYKRVINNIDNFKNEKFASAVLRLTTIFIKEILRRGLFTESCDEEQKEYD